MLSPMFWIPHFFRKLTLWNFSMFTCLSFYFVLLLLLLFFLILAMPRSMQDLSSPTRDWTHALPLHWQRSVLTTGPPGKSLTCILNIYKNVQDSPITVVKRPKPQVIHFSDLPSSLACAYSLLSFKLCYLKAFYVVFLSPGLPFTPQLLKIWLYLRGICSFYDYWCLPDWQIHGILLLETFVILLISSFVKLSFH